MQMHTWSTIAQDSRRNAGVSVRLVLWGVVFSLEYMAYSLGLGVGLYAVNVTPL